jgi:hypothetical protein
VTAGLIPVSLLLGFFLNTFAWMSLNSRMDARKAAELPKIYTEMREKLTEGLWTRTAAYFAKRNLGLTDVPKPPYAPEYLAYYYLPVVTLENLNYLWESYFCWYEFDVNTICALVLSVPAGRLPALGKAPGLSSAASCSDVLAPGAERSPVHDAVTRSGQKSCGV